MSLKVGDKVVIMVEYFDIPVGTMGIVSKVEEHGCDLSNSILCDSTNPHNHNMDIEPFFYFYEIRLATPLDEVLS